MTDHASIPHPPRRAIVSATCAALMLGAVALLAGCAQAETRRGDAPPNEGSSTPASNVVADETPPTTTLGTSTLAEPDSTPVDSDPSIAEPPPSSEIDPPATFELDGATAVTLPSAGVRPAEAPAAWVSSDFATNRLVIHDSDGDRVISDLEGPIDYDTDGACADGCGATRLTWDGEGPVAYAGADFGPGSYWSVDPRAAEATQLAPGIVPVGLASDGSRLALGPTGLLRGLDNDVANWDPVRLPDGARVTWDTIGAAALDRTGEHTYVVQNRGNDLAVWSVPRNDLASARLIASWPAERGWWPAGLEVRDDGRLLLATQRWEDDSTTGMNRPTDSRLLVIDSESQAVVERVSLPDGTSLVDIDKAGRFAILRTVASPMTSWFADSTFTWLDTTSFANGPLGIGRDAAW